MSAIPGIETTTSTEVVDWCALGNHLARIDSADQAAFLDGFTVGLADVPGQMQRPYIAQSVVDAGRADVVAEVLESLVWHLRQSRPAVDERHEREADAMVDAEAGV